MTELTALLQGEGWATPRTEAGQGLVPFLATAIGSVSAAMLILEVEDAERTRVLGELRRRVEELPGTPFRNSGEETDGMCPNCLTPWKCNGPHEPPALIPDGHLVDRAAVLALIEDPG